MKFARWTYWGAAVYGLLVILPLFFTEEKMGIDTPPPLNHPEYYYAFAGVTLVWQILFVLVALDPARFRPVMPVTILEKLSLLPALFILFPQGRFPQLWLPLVVIDLAFALLFSVAFVKSRVKREVPVAAA